MPGQKQALEFETLSEVYMPDGIEGEGATSIVHRVRDSEGKTWALKCLQPDQANSSRVKRFLNELHFCQNNSHQNVIRVVDQGFVMQKGKKCPFYVMPLYPSSLRKLLRTGMPPEQALSYYSQILDGVEAAHLRQVAHRDLKPENILHDPASQRLVVSDFGIAHFNADMMFTVVETRPSDRLANFQYAAPEQRTRGGSVDERADIYALGLMLNEMFTGQVLQGTGFKRIDSVAPAYAYLDELVEWMVQNSLDRRPASIDAIKQQLISRKNEFVSRQRLDALRHEVVPSSTVTHPLIESPPKVVDRDIQGNVLTLILDKQVPGKWIEAFKTPRSMGFINGTGPEDWNFAPIEGRMSASVYLPDHYLQPATAQPIIGNFKSYVEFANVKFRENLEADARAEEARKRKALQDQAAAEERRQKLLGSLKI